VQKELEISTVITDHDLGIKLDKAKSFLEKGYRVQFSFLKKNQKPFDPIVAKVKESLKDVGSENAASQPSPVKRLLVYIASSKSSKKPSSPSS
jgi:translation initiation factor IF-3